MGFYKKIILTDPCLQKDKKKKKKILLFLTLSLYLLWCNQKGDYTTIKLMPNNCIMHSRWVFSQTYFLVPLGVCKDHQLFYKMCDDGGDK